MDTLQMYVDHMKAKCKEELARRRDTGMVHEHCPCGTIIVISENGSPVKCTCDRIYTWDDMVTKYAKKAKELSELRMWWDDLPLYKQILLRTVIWLAGFYTVLICVLYVITN